MPFLNTTLAGRRMLVTGATGFIGSTLCRRLLELGAEVYGIARSWPSRHDELAIEWSAVDLAELEMVRGVFADARPDVVFHLASRVSGDRSLAAVGPTMRDNLITTVNVFTAACESVRPRIVLAGSMEEAGPDEPIPSSPYAAAKAAASAYGQMFHALYELPVVNLRVFMVYGPGQQDDTKLVPYVIRCLLRDEPPLLSSGTRAVDWVYVDDVAEAFVAAAISKDAPGTSVDIGSGRLVTIRELVAQLAILIGAAHAPHFGALPDRRLERSRVANLDAAERLLGWTPATSLQAGLEKTVAWYRDQRRHAED